MKVTIKEIKEHAKYLKSQKLGNKESWKRLHIWVSQFDNIYDGEDGLPRVRTKQGTYWSLMSSNIVGTFYFANW